MKKIILFFVVFVAFGLGSTPKGAVAQAPSECVPACVQNFECQQNFCVRIACEQDVPVTDWRFVRCENGVGIEEKTWQRYALFPDCLPWVDFEERIVERSECVLCDAPTVISSETPMGCPVLGKAQYRQQIRVCSVHDNAKVWVDAERIITRNNALCNIPLLGSYLINPILAIVLLASVIAIVAVLAFLKRR